MSEEALDRIDPPIDILIPGYSRRKLFRTWSETFRFMRGEQEAWRWLDGAGGPNPLAQVSEHQRNLINNGRNAAETLKDNPKHEDYGLQQKVKDALLAYESGDLVYSKSEDGQYILQLAEHNPREALGALATLATHNWPIQGWAWRPVIRGTVKLYLSRLEGSDQVERAASALDDLRGEWTERLNTQESEFAELTNRLEMREDGIKRAQDRVSKYWKDQVRKKRDFFNGAYQDKHALETAFREHMRLEAPAGYWIRKARIHALSAGGAFVGFTAATAGGAGVLFENASSLIDLVSPGNAGGLPLGNIVIVTLPALGFFWFLRFIARIFVTNIQRHQDAQERATMAQTYLSLVAEGEKVATDQERMLILHALFRPGPGDAPEDAPPANLLDIIRGIGRQRT